jgi:lipopolysaccharide biosynthesis glycosyltransferase
MAGLDLNGPYFNSGVMGINLRKWRETNAMSACLTVMDRYPGMFKAADQSVLNCAFPDDFLGVGDDINFPLYPNTPRLASLPAKVVHFVGSPKPWDLGGGMHKNHWVWRRFASDTALPPGLWRYRSATRILRILPSVFRCWKNGRKLSSQNSDAHRSS